MFHMNYPGAVTWSCIFLAVFRQGKTLPKSPINLQAITLSILLILQRKDAKRPWSGHLIWQEFTMLLFWKHLPFEKIFIWTCLLPGLFVASTSVSEQGVTAQFYSFVPNSFPHMLNCFFHLSLVLVMSSKVKDSKPDCKCGLLWSLP